MGLAGLRKNQLTNLFVLLCYIISPFFALIAVLLFVTVVVVVVTYIDSFTIDIACIALKGSNM